MNAPDLLVDGRTLDDRHPGVRRFWVPVLSAWAAAGGRGLLGYRAGAEPEPTLVGAGFEAMAIPGAERRPLALRAARRIVRLSGARATLSPLYLNLDGAPQAIATVFDVIGRTHPTSFGARLLWSVALRRTRRHASCVVVPSRASAAALGEAIPGLKDRLVVVPPIVPPPPTAAPDLLATHRVSSPFVLAIASHRTHKRLAQLVAAWRSAHTTLPLVLAGTGTGALDAPPLVRALGYVPDELIDALLAGARCLVATSEAEGFGLPVLAAMGAGVPVVATRIPAHEEVGGDAVFLVDPDAIDALVERAIEVAESESAGYRVAAARDRARAFSAPLAVEALDRALRA